MSAVFLDANVLVPITLADLLMRCAEKGLFRPLWSNVVLDELKQAIARVRPDLSPAKVEHRVSEMAAALPQALVEGFEGIEGGVVLPDPDDRHVVAAAHLGGAAVIVTANEKHFPSEVLSSYGLSCVHPDRFLSDLLASSPRVIESVLDEMVADAKNPPLTTDDVLVALGRAGVPGFVREYRAWVEQAD